MKQNDLLYIVISIFVLSLAWIGFSVYHARVNSTITETQNIQVVPIEPHFNKEIISKLKERAVVDPLFEASGPSATRSATPSPAVSVTPLATPAAGTASASGDSSQ